MNTPPINEHFNTKMSDFVGRPSTLQSITSLVLLGPITVWWVFLPNYSKPFRSILSLIAFVQFLIAYHKAPTWLLMGLGVSIAISVAIVTIGLIFQTYKHQSESRSEKAALQYFNSIVVKKNIPVLSDDSFANNQDEWITHRDTCTLFEYRHSGRSRSISYHRWFGGGSESKSQRDMSEILYPTAKGVLYISNQRFVFLGDKKSISRYHDEILSCQIQEGNVVLNISNAKPLIFKTSIINPFEARLFHSLFHKFKLYQPILPKELVG